MIEDRLRGMLLGMAVGDALGAAIEFKAPGTFEPVTDFRAGGPHGLDPGEWTDDTSMALALADSITNGGWDLADQMECYLAWKNDGRFSVNGRCFDIGMTVSSSLRAFRDSGDPTTSASRDEQSSGNGSIMRLAPVPIRYVHLFPTQVNDLARFAAESSLPTHASPQCLSACRYMAVLLAGLAHGRSREEVLDPGWGPVRELRAVEPFHPAVEEIAEGSFRRRQPPEIRGSGYVVHCLEASLWAFHDAATFEAAVLKAVNLGDDADTTGAVCGQFAGAFWGETGITQHWRDGLARRDMLENALAGLLGRPLPEFAEEPDESASVLDDVVPESVAVDVSEAVDEVRSWEAETADPLERNEADTGIVSDAVEPPFDTPDEGPQRHLF